MRMRISDGKKEINRRSEHLLNFLSFCHDFLFCLYASFSLASGALQMQLGEREHLYLAPNAKSHSPFATRRNRATVELFENVNVSRIQRQTLH
jgi:hypothetical protein